jgi:hypothetical protein
MLFADFIDSIEAKNSKDAGRLYLTTQVPS